MCSEHYSKADPEVIILCCLPVISNECEDVCAFNLGCRVRNLYSHIHCFFHSIISNAFYYFLLGLHISVGVAHEIAVSKTGIFSR